MSNSKTAFNIGPVARAVPYDNLTNGLSSTTVQNAIDEVDNEVNIQNIIWVKKNPGHKDFSSVAAAMASISGNTATNAFVIKVAPGLYVEPQIVMKRYVAIEGADMLSTIIAAADPTDDLIVGSNGTIANLALTGVTTAGKAGVRFTDSPGGSLILRQCLIQSCKIGLLVESITAITTTFSYGCIFVGMEDFGVKCTATGGFVSQAFMQHCTISLSTTTATALYGSGVGVTIFGNALVLQGTNSGNDIGISIGDGANFRYVGAEVDKFGIAFHIPNTGVTPVIDMLGFNFANNVIDVNIALPTADGCIGASIITRSKIINAAPNSFQLNYSDPITGDLNTTRISAMRGFATDLTSVATTAGTTQILSTDAHVYVGTGSTPGQIFQLPNATTLRNGHEYWIINEASVQVAVQQYGGSNLVYLTSGASIRYVLRDNSTSAGVWSRSSTISSPFTGTAPVLASYNGNANTGRYLEVWPSLASDTEPFIVPTSSVLVGLVLGSSTSSTGTVSVYKTSNLVTPIASISLVAQTEVIDISLNVVLSALDKLAIKVSAGSINKPRFAFYISGA